VNSERLYKRSRPLLCVGSREATLCLFVAPRQGTKASDSLELHAAESKRTRRHRRSSTRRRESLCVGMLVLKIENSWASLDFVTVHRPRRRAES
jgi:hypothetical protein